MGKLLIIIIAFFMPPLAVFFVDGIGKRFWLNVVLSLLGGVPGIIHALYVVALDD